MARLIDADALFEKGAILIPAKYYEGAQIVINAIRNAPTIEAEPIKHGRWEETEYSAYDDSYRCSACGEVWEFIEGTPKDNGANYCPNCGALMNLDEVEE